jgi:alkylresorcinol/alkylpyrone synthase
VDGNDGVEKGCAVATKTIRKSRLHVTNVYDSVNSTMRPVTPDLFVIGGLTAVATVSAIATTVPEHRLALADTTRSLQQIMRIPQERAAAMRSIFLHAGVAQRHSPYPIEHFSKPRSLTQASAEYREHAIRLGRAVGAECLARAGILAGEVDFLVTASCTGLMMPSLDAYLVNELDLRRDVRRLPITELGCAGGAAALSRACDYLKAYPQSTVLVVSVELPTLTFQPDDGSMANIVSCALFGDGAAAALIRGDDHAGTRIVDSTSHLFPDSYDALGFDLLDGGLHIVLGRHLPALVRAGLGEVVDRFLALHGLGSRDIGFWVIHPGGTKLILQIEEVLGLSREQTQPTWDVLRECGNLSSASVLFVLERWMAMPNRRSGELGMMLGFGPGFSAELLLMQWT